METNRNFRLYKNKQKTTYWWIGFIKKKNRISLSYWLEFLESFPWTKGSLNLNTSPKKRWQICSSKMLPRDTWHWYQMAEYHKGTARITRQRQARFCNVTCQSLCIVPRSTLTSMKTIETYKVLQWLKWDFSIISDILLSEANKPRASLSNCGNRRILPYRVSSGVWESFSMVW